MIKCDTLKGLISPIESDLDYTINNLYQNLKSDNDFLNNIIYYTISSGGKRIRPAISLLISRLFLDDLVESNYKIAQISEIIHTASLMHDDVIDNADTRRSVQTVNSQWGNAMSIISGDYFLARASTMLASLDNVYIVRLFSVVLEEICLGEILQNNLLFDTSITWDQYLLKSERKTARLFASATEGAAVVSKATPNYVEASKIYGLNLGIAFQIIDDILNFSSDKIVGKPICQDLRSGIITAPVIYAIEEYPELISIINSEFENQSDFEKALEIINNSSGIPKSRELSNKFIDKAVNALEIFENSEIKTSLVNMAKYIVDRSF